MSEHKCVMCGETECEDMTYWVCNKHWDMPERIRSLEAELAATHDAHRYCALNLEAETRRANDAEVRAEAAEKEAKGWKDAAESTVRICNQETAALKARLAAAQKQIVIAKQFLTTSLTIAHDMQIPAIIKFLDFHPPEARDSGLGKGPQLAGQVNPNPTGKGMPDAAAKASGAPPIRQPILHCAICGTPLIQVDGIGNVCTNQACELGQYIRLPPAKEE